MKNKLIIALAVCLSVMAFCLVGCGGDKYADSPYVGDWAATTAEYEGMSVDVAEVMSTFEITLNADGSVDVVVDGENATGEWEETESGVIVTDNTDESIEFTDDGNGGLTIDQDGVIIHFEKQ
ncbi:hypothetical protein [Slackia heliotrinireducens]|uniref:hypothetical protein n=1 Tax=Slackia heliotrinireducens TaxID=84110 RepID=UPI0033152C44